MAPQSHPRAQFVPCSPDLDLNGLVENTSNFDYVTRLPKEMLKEHSIQSLEQLVLLHVVIGGKPLVIEGWDERFDPWLFSTGWLQENLGKHAERVRDIPNEVDIPMTMGHYLNSMNQLTDQFTSSNFRDPKRQRLYLKDIDTPEEWARDLKEFIPEIFFYLNDCIESRTGSDGAILEPNEYGQMRYGKGVAPAGDLMSSLPSDMRALNMMCYIGHEGTYTPAHREMCASLGHNIMVEASKDGRNEKAGSSIWFMTETKEREVVSEYFLSMLGHDIEVEKHFAQINAWKKAPFNVWIVEQKVGDLILIPPLAPHQVWNRGTRTMKAAWNRTTVDTLELAIHEALPRARMVCRDEQYKNKAIIYYTLIKYHGLIQRNTIEAKMWKYGRIKQLLEDFKRLFALYTEILVSEMFSPALPTESDVEFLPFDSNVTCSYCRCNIWNRFLTCKTCIETAETGEEDTYDICMDCYAMGRSCGCISNLKWVEQWDWAIFAQSYDAWRHVVVEYDGYFNIQTSPQPLEVARKRYGKKPVAQVCQEQLKIRPWQDIKNPTIRELSIGMSDDEPEVDDEGRLKKKKGRTKRWKGKATPKKDKTRACHVCCRHHENWKMAFCTTCTNSYCYGVLWRAFDLMPQEVMEDRDWSCPKCLMICSCGKCRKNPTQKPYAPKGTLLGHDTKKVADFRSVESLVDFSKTNLGWLRDENDDNPQESTRMKKLKEKAEAEKAREDTIDENYVLDNGDQFANEQEETHDPFLVNIADIDPQLRGDPSISIAQSNGNGHYRTPHAPADPDMDGLGHGKFNTEVSQQSGWLDGYCDLGVGANTRPSAGYPSKRTAPVVLMQAQTQTQAEGLEQSYPDPSHHGQNRMMGIGYYQQGHGIDKILYDPPDLKTTTEDPANLSFANPAVNPNFAFSDLLQPKKEAEKNTKKRRHGHANGDEDDREFFTSKRQRSLAESKGHSGMDKPGSQPEDEVHHKVRPAPRRSVPKPKTYSDLGEEAVPITEDDILPASRVPKKKVGNEIGDLTPAEHAVSHLTGNPTSERRRSSRGQTSSITTSPSAAALAKSPRKSAWLARKEAEEAGEEFLADKRKREQRKPGLDEKTTASNTIGILSESECDNDNGGVQIDDEDSLFGDLDAGDASSDRGVQWHVCDENPKVQIAGPRRSIGSREDSKPIPNRRSRSRKQASVATLTRRPSPLRSTINLPSLKEKLALQGKTFQTVVAKPRKSIESPPSQQYGHTTLSIVIPRSVANSTPLISPMVANGTTNPSLVAESGVEPLTVGKLSNENSSMSGKPVEPPAKKGFTVVRLMSPDEESGVSEESMSGDPSPSDDSSGDDDDIPPTVPSSIKLSRDGGSLHGKGRSRGGVSNGVGMASRRRGRPIKSSH